MLLALRNGGKYNGYQLLKPETVAQMLNPESEAFGSKIGLIWLLYNENKPNAYFGHGGAYMWGWNNDARAYANQDFSLVISTNQWEMNNIRSAPEITLIANFISEWLANEKTHPHPAPASFSWAWKVSYVIGLEMAERTRGGLGVQAQFSPEAVEAMARGAIIDSGSARNEETWDPEGFRAGLHDMEAVEMTPAAIRAFLKSDKFRIPPEELEVIHRELGGEGAIFPWPLFVPPSKD